MKTQAVIALTISVIIGASVGTMSARSVRAEPGPSCTGTNHCVDLTIVGGTLAPIANVVVPEKNHQIYWRIKTSGFNFPLPPTDGMTFKAASSINDNGRMPAQEFPCNRVSSTLFHCADANSTHGAVRRYQYSVTVIDASGQKIISDPWIINN